MTGLFPVLCQNLIHWQRYKRAVGPAWTVGLATTIEQSYHQAFQLPFGEASVDASIRNALADAGLEFVRVFGHDAFANGYRSRDFVRAGRGDAPSQDRERGAWQDRRALSNRNTSIM